ncbi:response regulator [Treponema sp.]|uniref:response regulator n=1 Tax=Treponema sp. TaxID=166 RepID=UPI00298E617A|nr:response regulator [Treponema sp.]MCQ2241633.1 response regulator [Treponema sp.]
MKIICCDDEKNLLTYHKNMLLSMDEVSEVFDFSYAEDVLEFAKNNKDVDLAILDINLPVMNGIELAEKLKVLIPSIKIIFITGYSEYKTEATENGCSGYLTKPTNANEVKKELSFVMQEIKASNAEKVRVQCFGNFDLFINDKVVTFSLTKAKELLAYLVDKRGSTVSGGELCAVLWENNEDDGKNKNNLRHCWLSLKQALEPFGVQSILKKGWNCYGIDVNSFWCDAYEFEKGNVQVINSYKGEYMNQYSWAENSKSIFSKKTE